MIIEFLLSGLTFIATLVGTLSGFGLSTIMIPLVNMTLSSQETLVFVGIIHWFSNIWKTALFYTGINKRVVALFVIPSMITAYLGAHYASHLPDILLKRILGCFLIGYTLFMLFKPSFQIPATVPFTLLGGALAGLCTGLFGSGGAIWAAFLISYNLPPATYIATLGIIELFGDSTRITTYLAQGITLPWNLIITIVIALPISFLGAWVAKRYLYSLKEVPKLIFKINRA